MYLTTAALMPAARAEQERLDASEVAALLWSVADPDDGLEHISVRIGDQQIEVGCFHRAATLLAANRATHRMCRRAVAAHDQLQAWDVRMTRELSGIDIIRYLGNIN